MRIHILTVGKVKDRVLAGKLEEYLKRIRFEAKIDVISVKDSDREREGERLLEALERFKRDRVYALTEEGKQYSSPSFARQLGRAEGGVVFVIGGPDGLAECVKQRADAELSLSKMTFPA